MQEEIEFINNIISSNILASNINMLVANNLNIESRQNTSNSKSMSFGIGASIAFFRNSKTSLAFFLNKT